MWFVGMIVGAVIGAMGHAEGAVIGGIVGLFVGALLSSASKKGAADTRIATLEDAVRKLHDRVKALEGGAAAVPRVDAAMANEAQSAQPGPGATPPVPDVPAPVLDITHA